MPPKKKKKVKKKTCNDSKQATLHVDLIRLILERLSFVDLHRARSVSSQWYLASTTTFQVRNPTSPWIILFPEERNDDGWCKIFDPISQCSYVLRDLGFSFSRSRCVASSGSWLLMTSHIIGLYLLNVFTRERILLPAMESIHGLNIGGGNINDIGIINAVLWVDEENKNYLVVYNFDDFFAYHKRRDCKKSWKVITPLLRKGGCNNMVFKENKLYILGTNYNIIVFDFSGDDDDSPREAALFVSHLFYVPFDYNLVVSLSGQVLLVESSVIQTKGGYDFNVYKVSGELLQWEIADLGDEVLLLDLGLTVAVKDELMKKRIYFSIDKIRRLYTKWVPFRNDATCAFVYDIQSESIVQEFQHLIASSPIPYKDARWFLPTFSRKWLL